MAKKMLLSLVVLAAAALAITACGPKSVEATPAPVVAQASVMIAEGRLMPVNALDHAFHVPGQVAEVLVKDGDAVEAGQALARLNESPEAALALARTEQEMLAAQQALNALKTGADVNLTQAKLAALEAQDAQEAAQDRYDSDASEQNQAALDAAEADLQLAKDTRAKLNTNDGIDPDLLAAAEARLFTAQSAQSSAAAAMDALTLVASMDGTVIDLDLQAGQLVGAGAPILTLADMTGWVVKTDNLTEVDITDVSIGQEVEVVLDALPDVKLTGEVTHINARYEEKRGDITYTVTVKLSDADPRMRWGMTAAVKFIR